MAHDYGERQPRVDFLLKAFREMPPDHVLTTDVLTGQPVTAAKMVHEIEAGTMLGKTCVAVAGLVIQALKSDRPPGRKRATQG